MSTKSCSVNYCSTKVSWEKWRAHKSDKEGDWQSDSTHCEKFSWIEFSRLIWGRKKEKTISKRLKRSLCCLNPWKPVLLWTVLLKEHTLFMEMKVAWKKHKQQHVLSSIVFPQKIYLDTLWPQECRKRALWRNLNPHREDAELTLGLFGQTATIALSVLQTLQFILKAVSGAQGSSGWGERTLSILFLPTKSSCQCGQLLGALRGSTESASFKASIPMGTAFSRTVCLFIYPNDTVQGRALSTEKLKT